MRVLICDPISASAVERIKYAGIDVEDLSSLPKEELINRVKDFDAMVVRSATKVRQPMIDKMERMKLIIRGGVGIDNIDADYAKQKGIEVKNTPAASSRSVAEITIGHMLALARHIARGTQSIKEGNWEKKALKGTELLDKTLGIIGIGRIGKEVIKIAKALGMKVIAYDPYVKEVDDVELVDLNTLLNSSDYISIHVPFTPETKYLLDKAEFEKMKDGVIVINCARGGVVNESALLEAIKSGKVGGTGIDVFEVEPPKSSKLLNLPNVTFTPHIGAATSEAQARIGEEVANILIEFAKQT
jgi:D-3-phosphoglycerate dehydrogenase